MTAPTEGQVMFLLACGLSQAEIARRFEVSPSTVRTRVRRIQAHARRWGPGETMFRHAGREIEIARNPDKKHRIDEWLFTRLDDVRG